MLRCTTAVLAFASFVLATAPGSQSASPANAQEPKPSAQEPKPADPAAPGSSVPGAPAGVADLDPIELAKAMNATMQLATPGPQHAKLCAHEGYHEVVMDLTPPGAPAQQFQGEARAMSVLGGRYLLVNLRVKLAGVIMEGLYVFGFDNLRQNYTMSWRDSLSTWAVDCSGPPPEKEADPVEMKGVLVDAASPTGREFGVELRFHADGFSLEAIDKVKDKQAVVMKQRFVKKPDPRATGGEQNEKPASGGGKR